MTPCLREMTATRKGSEAGGCVAGCVLDQRLGRNECVKVNTLV